MVVVEIISHVARLLSLTVRLWVNMMVSEMLYVIFLGLSVALFLSCGARESGGVCAGPGAAAGAGDFLSFFIFSSRSCRRLCSRFFPSFISVGRLAKRTNTGIIRRAA